MCTPTVHQALLLVTATAQVLTTSVMEAALSAPLHVIHAVQIPIALNATLAIFCTTTDATALAQTAVTRLQLRVLVDHVHQTVPPVTPSPNVPTANNTTFWLPNNAPNLTATTATTALITTASTAPPPTCSSMAPASPNALLTTTSQTRPIV